MKTLAFAFTAAALMFTPALAGSELQADKPIVLAQDINVRVGVPGAVVTTAPRRTYVRRASCKQVTVKERRGGVTVIKKRTVC